MFSISPAPNVGVGIRKITLLSARLWAKFGWLIWQLPPSERPRMTNRSCTPPSAWLLSAPLGFNKNLKRASTVGPSGVTNDGSVFRAPLRLNTCVSGLGPTKGNAVVLGLLPPMLGCAWQLEHWFVLKRGPSPLFVPPCTLSTA